MSRKAWLITAAVLIVLGLLMFGGAMTALRWDFTQLSTVEYETNTYEIRDPFTNISVLTDTADISFFHGSECKVICKETSTMHHTVTVENGILTISQPQPQRWQDYIGINTEAPKITVYLPAPQYDNLLIAENTGDIHIPEDFLFNTVEITVSTGDVENYASTAENLRIRTSTGHIRMENISAGTVCLDVSTGRIHLKNISCNSLQSAGDTGNITMEYVIAKETLSIKRNTGDVTFNRCDAGQIIITTDTGNVTGSLLSGKTFLTDTDTGKVKVPSSTTGGKCQITTDTGDIRITVE